LHIHRDNICPCTAFPGGILQPPFFSRGYPKSINYGAIGAVIGHEVTHGFDDQGRNYDADGNLFNWWQLAAQKGFNDRKECIVKQYSAYKLNEINMNVRG
jgi:predicted metalloendopeptidase